MTSAFLGMLADTSIRAAVAAVLVGAAIAAVRARAGAIRQRIPKDRSTRGTRTIRRNWAKMKAGEALDRIAPLE